MDGRRVHTRVDHANEPLPEPETLEDDNTRVTSRSLTFPSEKLGVINKIDVAEVEDGAVTPVDYKRSKRPHIAQGTHGSECI